MMNDFFCCFNVSSLVCSLFLSVRLLSLCFYADNTRPFLNMQHELRAACENFQVSSIRLQELCRAEPLTSGSSRAGCRGEPCGGQSPCRRCPRWPAEQSPTGSLRQCGSTRRRGDCPGVSPAPETS